MSQLKEKTDWLKALLSILSALLLIVVYLVLNSSAEGVTYGRAAFNLIQGAIPSAVVVLLAGVLVYFFLVRKGLGVDDELADSLVEKLASRLGPGVPAKGGSPRLIGVLAFFPNYRDINWTELLSVASSVDIAVSYYDSWVKQNHEHIVALFRRGGSVRVVVSSPNDADAMKLTAARFPEYTLETVKEKVRNTGVRFFEALQESHSRSGRLEVYYFPGVINYSAIRINNQVLLLSIYEHFRQQRIDSSAILMDLDSSDHLRAYWDKEIGGLIQASAQVPSSQWNRSSK